MVTERSTANRNCCKTSEDVHAEMEEKEGEIHLTLSVNEQDMGKVIGRSGRIAKAIRSVMNAAASKQNLRISIDIQ